MAKASDAATSTTGDAPGATGADVTPEASAAPVAEAAEAPRLFAVVALGGTQYKVTPGDVVNAEYIPGAQVGSELVLRSVLALCSATRSVLGRPTVPGAAVRVAVEEVTLDRKVVIFKKKRRKRYQRLRGHRRRVTRLRVVGIEEDGPYFVDVDKQ